MKTAMILGGLPTLLVATLCACGSANSKGAVAGTSGNTSGGESNSGGGSSGGTPAASSGGTQAASSGGTSQGTGSGGTSAGNGSGGTSAGNGSGGRAGGRANGGSTSAGGTTAGRGGSGNTAGAIDIASGGANPTTCATPGGTPMGTAKGTAGVWQSVTPSGLTFDTSAFSNDNFGVQDVLVDPVRPSDLYTFVCHQGVWKSTDYGSTWVKVNKGTNAAVVDSGKPWGSGIDSNRCRDPNVPPTLYTLNGAGSMNGFLKSIDGGVNWTHTQLPDQPGTQYTQDAYSIAVDPYDGRHIVMGFHEEQGLVESKDAGNTWVVRKPGDSAMSVYNFFVDTGNAATTGKTWLSLGQTGKMWRTTDGATTWTQVETLQHSHGCSQLFQAGGGVIYAPGTAGTHGAGIYRSADFGLTWTNVAPSDVNNVVGTPTKLYANYGWASAIGTTPEMQSAARTPGTSWASMPTPAGMTNGSKGAAVTYDGTHYIIVSGNWNAGIWRYIEP